MRSVARVTVYLRRGDLRNEVIVRERSAEKGMAGPPLNYL